MAGNEEVSHAREAWAVDARLGDAFRVATAAVADANRDKKEPRPYICVAELPSESTWRGMARLTSGAGDRPEDLPSRANQACGLSDPGWWSVRFVRLVKKRWTGHPHLCKGLPLLPDDERKAILDHYRQHQRDKKRKNQTMASVGTSPRLSTP
jgi:hypothetical protein